MTRDEISARVRAIITHHLAQVKHQPMEVNEATKWVKDLPLDSLDFIDITMAVEDDLSIELVDERVSNVVTVGEFIDYVAEVAA